MRPVSKQKKRKNAVCIENRETNRKHWEKEKTWLTAKKLQSSITNVDDNLKLFRMNTGLSFDYECQIWMTDGRSRGSD